ADAIVSTGSIDKHFTLPKLTPIGGDMLRLSPETGGVDVDAAGPLEFTIAHEMYCGSNHTGFSPLTTRPY
ncbi:glycine/sarcosine/betaine reductase component B subunit, partial [Eubacteriales bacterium OttesenSCG-928-N14]|nr:glycine/sarcosine/betaine reductase component B subunit [Eubacteriales bacterium OttesenSCG-928-N14]